MINYQRPRFPAPLRRLPQARIFVALIVSILTLGVTFSSGLTVPVHADTGSNWQGSYYNNQDLSGSPVFTRIDPAIVFNWGPYGPGSGVGGQHWSARWTSETYLNAGTYQFVATSDDGVRLFIDGQTVIDGWHDQVPTTYSADASVVTGTHLIEVDYYQNQGNASLTVSWNYVSSPSTQWTAQYFNNPYLQGAPVVARYENGINYDWGIGGSPDPAVPFNYFSGRWIASLPFNAGTYRFNVVGSNGVRLYIDDATVIDQWQINPAVTDYVIDIPLSSGIHTLRLEYFEWTGDATIKLDYQTAVGPPPYQNQTWYGEYFSNPNLQGSAVFNRDDGSSGIAFDWSNSTPGSGIGHDFYSVRWTRTVYFPAGNYTFYLTSDDGSRLYIDGNLSIDQWQVQSVRTVGRTVTLSEGFHTLRMEYFQNQEKAIAGLTWDPPAGQSPVQPVGGGITPPNTGVTATVTAGELNVRSGPSTGYDILGTMENGQTVPVTGRAADNSWLQVNANGLSGWSSAAYLNVNGDLNTVPVASSSSSAAPSGSTGVRVQMISQAVVYNGPNGNSQAIDSLPFGAQADVIGRTADDSWLQVNYSGGSGWIYAPYARITSGSLLNAPITG